MSQHEPETNAQRGGSASHDTNEKCPVIFATAQIRRQREKNPALRKASRNEPRARGNALEDHRQDVLVIRRKSTCRRRVRLAAGFVTTSVWHIRRKN